MRSARGRARTWSFAFVLFLTVAEQAAAQGAEADDRGTELSDDDARDAEERRLPWHDTLFVWDHSVTPETVGLGRDVQSRNPTYEMTFRLAPRYYFIDETRRTLSARADARLIREFTNSDTTTERGEWTFADTELWLSWVEVLRDVPGARTDFVLRAPSFSFPTSKVSASGGKLLGLGLGVGVDQGVPLRGDGAHYLESATLRFRAGYSYQFVDSTVPTNDAIGRVRLDPSGRSLPSDQLGGAAFPQHQGTLDFRIETLVVPNLTLIGELGLFMTYKYALEPHVELCEVVDTGCIDVSGNANATRYGAATLFGLELDYEISDVFSVSLGYANLSPQIGANGRRRSVFYSPDARASLSLTVALDALYSAAAGDGARASARVAAPPAF